MNRNLRYILLALATIIVVASLYITNRFIKIFEEEERAKVEVWAEATKRLLSDTVYNDFAFHIVERNENIPVVIVDDQDRYISSRNLDEPSEGVDEYRAELIKKLKRKNPPILIDLGNGEKQYIYYDDSKMLKWLSVYPYVQLLVVFAFVLLIVWLIISTHQSEENKIWVGLTKETAHQLGTPISSLSAWVEIMRTNYPEDKLVPEMSKDVEKLMVITERFSKIGSLPELNEENVVEVVKTSVEYMQNRSAKNIKYTVKSEKTDICAVISEPLFRWVIENLMKNALDAMDGNGEIDINIKSRKKYVVIDVTDTGKGIDKSKWGDVFSPGYTTKLRGWGLGLSLAKRIVVNYHKGKIFVKYSEIGKGTQFRVLLPEVKK